MVARRSLTAGSDRLPFDDVADYASRRRDLRSSATALSTIWVSSFIEPMFKMTKSAARSRTSRGIRCLNTRRCVAWLHSLSSFRRCKRNVLRTIDHEHAIGFSTYFAVGADKKRYLQDHDVIGVLLFRELATHDLFDSWVHNRLKIAEVHFRVRKDNCRKRSAINVFVQRPKARRRIDQTIAACPGFSAAPQRREMASVSMRTAPFFSKKAPRTSIFPSRFRPSDQ